MRPPGGMGGDKIHRGRNGPTTPGRGPRPAQIPMRACENTRSERRASVKACFCKGDGNAHWGHRAAPGEAGVCSAVVRRILLARVRQGPGPRPAAGPGCTWAAAGARPAPVLAPCAAKGNHIAGQGGLPYLIHTRRCTTTASTILSCSASVNSYMFTPSSVNITSSSSELAESQSGELLVLVIVASTPIQFARWVRAQYVHSVIPLDM